MHRIPAAGLVAIALLAVSAAAHHSVWAEFDNDRPVELTGTVTEMKWSNPHAWIYIDVEDEEGNVVNWALETQAANGLIRRGWRKDDMKPGDVITVRAFRARNGTNNLAGRLVTLADGRRVFAGSTDGGPTEAELTE